MAISDNDVLRVTAKMSWSSGTRDVQNVYHLLYSGTGDDDADVVDDIATLLDGAYAEVIGYIPDDFAFETIEVWNLTQDQPVDEVDWPTLVEGTALTTALPAQLAPLVLFSTNAPRSQGRKYLPFFTEAEATGWGQISAVALAAVADFAADFLADVVFPNGDGKWGNWNKLLSRFAPWLSAAVDTLFRTQRRRVAGVGS